MASRLSMITMLRLRGERDPAGATELPGGVVVQLRSNWRLPMPCRCRRGHEWRGLRGSLAQTEKHISEAMGRRLAAGRWSESSSLKDRGTRAGPPNAGAFHPEC